MLTRLTMQSLIAIEFTLQVKTLNLKSGSKHVWLDNRTFEFIYYYYENPGLNGRA